MANILMLGAGECQLNLINRLKKEGHCVHISDYYKNSPGKEGNTFNYLVSTYDLDENLKIAKYNIHNFPEGIATFMAALNDPTLGAAIAIAIAIHNIPEGIAVAVPVFYATGSRWKAFKLSFLSGLSEPVGAIIGYLVLFRFLNDAVFGFIFAMVAGIMVYISVDELLPSAREYGKHHLSIYGMIAGMAVMALSLLLLA